MYDAEALKALEEYCAEVGFSENAIQKIFKIGVRNVEAVRNKIKDYQKMLNIKQADAVKTAGRFVSMLSMETKGQKPTAVQNKMQGLQTILHLDEASTRRLMTRYPQITGLAVDSVKNKLHEFQTVLQADEATVVRMLIGQPSLFTYDVYGKQETSVVNKIKTLQTILETDFKTVVTIVCRAPAILTSDMKNENSKIQNNIASLRRLLHVDTATICQMVLRSPMILGMENTTAQKKLDRMSQVVPFEDLRGRLIERPAILSVPKDSFKIRYMIAENFDCVPAFWHSGYLTNPNKAWARGSHLTWKHSGAIKLSQIYLSENNFNSRFNVGTQELIQKYPLDGVAVQKIEMDYQNKTAMLLKLEPQELATLGLADTKEQTLA